MKLTRQSWLGVLAGLSAGSILRREAAGGFEQTDIRRVYNLWAPIYGLADVYLLGQLPRLRQIAVERLRLRPGSSVLEIRSRAAPAPISPISRNESVRTDAWWVSTIRRPCSKRPDAWLHERAGEMSRWYTPMPRRSSWRNSLTAYCWYWPPRWCRTGSGTRTSGGARQAWGWLVIADARLSERWYTRPFNWLADLLGVGAAADIGRRPWELLPRYLTNVGYEELLLGFLYVAWGQRVSRSGE